MSDEDVEQYARERWPNLMEAYDESQEASEPDIRTDAQESREAVSENRTARRRYCVSCGVWLLTLPRSGGTAKEIQYRTDRRGNPLIAFRMHKYVCRACSKDRYPD